MAFCRNCGTELGEGQKFCASCGAATNEAGAQPSGGNGASFGERVSGLNDTADTTLAYDATDIEQNKVMAVLAYLGILVLIPILAAPNSKFARYHANQGLVLMITEIAYGIAYSILSAIVFAISWRLGFIVSLLGLFGIVFLVFAILGIVNAASGKAKELPIIGKIQILK